MDDYKRTLYMQALTILYQARKDYKLAFICHELRRAFYNEHSDSHRPSEFDNNFHSSEIVREFFPEFRAMFDGKCYYSDGDAYPIHINEVWWEATWIEPRICALEYILRD